MSSKPTDFQSRGINSLAAMTVEKAEAPLPRPDRFKSFGEKPKSATSMHGLITEPGATERDCLLSFHSGSSVATFS